jgi:ketosteroid isomerase-like protein
MKTTVQLAAFIILASSFLVKTNAGQDKDRAGSPSQTQNVQAALARFVTAFENLDWTNFRDCFSANATIFHPAAPNISRIDSPEAFDKAWLGVFERIKKNSGRTSPPYMKLKPQDVRIDRLSPEVALVTFHLVDPGTLGRRTLVFQRVDGAWKIIHVHASNVP